MMYLVDPQPTISIPRGKHPSVYAYKAGCKCDACREVWRLYRYPKVKAWRDRKRRERKLEDARQLLREAGELP